MARTRARGGALKLMKVASQLHQDPSAQASEEPPAGGSPGEAPAPIGVQPVGVQPEAPLEALVDGKRVVIEAADEIVLRCGKASITLRRNGRVIIRGTYVETRAEGVNRVKGGSVQIN